MREIKFRAWDKNIETMVDPAFLQLDGNGLTAGFYENCDPEESAWETDPEILKNIILMQYTGLHDKNGKEIYEGDIIAGEVHTWQVKWDDEDAGFYLSGIDGKFADWIGYAHQFEVIGNIYESKELLDRAGQ